MTDRLARLILVGAALSAVAARGRVVDATRDRAFFDVGAADGLQPGARVRLGNKGRRRRCRVDQVAEHFASCEVSGARVGDPVRFRARRVEREEAPVAARAVPAVDARAAAARLAAAPVPLVSHTSRVASPLSWRAEAGWTHQSSVRAAADFHREQLDATVVDVPLGFLETRASADLTVIGWASRPAAARFRTDERAMLYVHETAVHRRRHEAGTTLAVGRIRPWFTPGIAYLDGAQLGYRLSDHAEVGVIGGLLPDVITLEPSRESWLGGVYGQYRVGRVQRFSVQGRLGAAGRPGTTGAEGETQLGFQLRQRLSLRGAARAVVEDGGFSLSSVRAAVAARPVRWLELDASGRLRDDRPDPGAPEWSVVGADHARAAAWVRLGPRLRLGASGQTSHLRADDEWRHGVGPEAAWQVNAQVGLGLGYQEAFGWLPGRTAWTMVSLWPSRRLRLSLRASYLADRFEDDTVHAAGTYAMVDWRTPWSFDVRCTGLARAPIAGDDDLGPAFVLRASLIGRL